MNIVSVHPLHVAINHLVWLEVYLLRIRIIQWGTNRLCP